MRVFARALAELALAVALGVAIIYIAGSLAVGMMTLVRRFSSPLGGAVVLVVFVVAAYGFVDAFRFFVALLEGLQRRHSLESLEIHGAKRAGFIGGGIVVLFGVLAVVSQIAPGPVPSPVAFAVTAVAVVFGVAGLLRRLRREPIP